MNPQLPDILICRCRHRQDVVPPQTRAALEHACASAQVWLVDDLCRLAAENDPRLAAFADRPAPVIVACHVRAVRALFAAAGAELPAQAQILNQREQSSEEIRAALAPRLQPGETQSEESDDDWQPWFPVIDRSRCTNCRQCLNFCLFGAYEPDNNGHVRVAQPRHCKTNCPACARICPAVAIIFPKYDAAPINGGPIDSEEAQQERVRVDTQKILGNDVYAALRQRRAGRSLLSDEARQEQEIKAQAERAACIRREQEGGI